MKLTPEGPRLGADGANAGGNGGVESTPSLDRFGALVQPTPLILFEPHSVDTLKQTLGAELIEEESPQKRLIHTTTAEDPFTHSKVTSTTAFKIVEGDKAVMESILSKRDDGTPDALIEYSYDHPDDTHYRLTSLQTYLQIPTSLDQTAQTTKYPIEKSDFFTDPNGVFDRNVTRFEGDAELNDLLFPPSSLPGGPEQDATEYIAKARKAAERHPSYQVFDQPDGKTTVRKITVDRSAGAARPTRLNITDMTFDASQRLETFISNEHPMRPGIDTATQTIDRYTYADGYLVTLDELYAGQRTIYNYGHQTLITPDGTPVTICNQIIVDQDGYVTTLDLDQLRTAAKIDPTSPLAMYRGMFGFDPETMDSTNKRGRTIRRHASLYLLPSDMELVVNKPGRRAKMTLRRKEMN